MQSIITCALAFLVSAIAGRFIVPALRALKVGQSIREIGPTWHNSKQGTPTMGGLIFMLGIAVCIVTGWRTMLGGDVTHLMVFGLALVCIVSLDTGERLEGLKDNIFDVFSEAGIQNRRIQYRQIAVAVFRNELPVLSDFLAVSAEMIQLDDKDHVPGVYFFDHPPQRRAIGACIGYFLDIDLILRHAGFQQSGQIGIVVLLFDR